MYCVTYVQRDSGTYFLSASFATVDMLSGVLPNTLAMVSPPPRDALLMHLWEDIELGCSKVDVQKAFVELFMEPFAQQIW